MLEFFSPLKAVKSLGEQITSETQEPLKAVLILKLADVLIHSSFFNQSVIQYFSGLSICLPFDFTDTCRGNPQLLTDFGQRFLLFVYTCQNFSCMYIRHFLDDTLQVRSEEVNKLIYLLLITPERFSQKLMIVHKYTSYNQTVVLDQNSILLYS